VAPLDLLTQLIRTNTTNPPGGEEPAAELLRSRLDDAGLKTELYKSPGGRTSLVARIEGPTDRPALVLLSHTDVVGVEPDHWTHDPFGAETDGGFLWGRGTLDMKGIAVMHTEAAAAVAASGVTPQREVIVVSVADEEARGVEGARWLLAEHLNALGFGDGRPPPEVLGEGSFGLSGILDVPIMPIALGEKVGLWVEARAEGTPGHGSVPPPRQAALNLTRFLAEIAGYGPPRLHPVMKEQFKGLAAAAKRGPAQAFRVLSSGAAPVAIKALAPALRARGAIGALVSDTISLTVIESGYKHNVIPGEAKASLDCRLLPDTDPDLFLSRLQRRARRHSVTLKAQEATESPVSEKGPLWSALAEASLTVVPNSVIVPTLSPGMTDTRYFRAAGATGYGWVPLVLTPELVGTIHGHNERIHIDDFERAVAAMTDVVLRSVHVSAR
jgi:acetylornithine deacetylase/succinyl-diaminopimelate desuccinylase-like protein